MTSGDACPTSRAYCLYTPAGLFFKKLTYCLNYLSQNLFNHRQKLFRLERLYDPAGGSG